VEESARRKSRTLPRCSVCRLPANTLARVHEDRLRSHLTLGAITGELREAGHDISESALRRHLGRHVPDLDYSPISQAGRPQEQPTTVATAFDNLIGKELDPTGALEAATTALVEMMQALVRDFRTAAGQRSQVGERVLGQFLKMQNALVRSLKELEVGRTKRDEFRRVVPQIVDRIVTEAVRSIASLMRENGKRLREDIVEVGHERMTLDEFWSRLSRYENEWAMEVGTRMRAATKEALQTEEGKVQA
jgi:hypothetical protein